LKAVGNGNRLVKKDWVIGDVWWLCGLHLRPKEHIFSRRILAGGSDIGLGAVTHFAYAAANNSLPIHLSFSTPTSVAPSLTRFPNYPNLLKFSPIS